MRKIFFWIGAISALALGASYFVEFALHLQPCFLCLIQRVFYILLFSAALAGFFTAEPVAKLASPPKLDNFKAEPPPTTKLRSGTPDSAFRKSTYPIGHGRFEKSRLWRRTGAPELSFRYFGVGQRGLGPEWSFAAAPSLKIWARRICLILIALNFTAASYHALVQLKIVKDRCETVGNIETVNSYKELLATKKRHGCSEGLWKIGPVPVPVLNTLVSLSLFCFIWRRRDYQVTSV